MQFKGYANFEGFCLPELLDLVSSLMVNICVARFNEFDSKFVQLLEVVR